ncbi:MAG: single-stranded DNA-binding protein [Patescibacteria group bacterium]|nr:single-stranded DNA-binding protein [Patescibacteria group bacterium]
MYLNKAFLYGNLTRDPEVRALPSGQQVASFSLATNRTYKGKDGEKQESVEFHNIVAFGRQADVIAQYLKKGRPVFIEGRIQTRSWEDKASGDKKYRTEIVVENFQFGPNGGGTGGSSYAPRGETGRGKKETGDDKSADIEYPSEEISPDDIPF